MGSIHENVPSIYITFSSLAIEGLEICSVGTSISSSESLLLASFDRVFLYTFFTMGFGKIQTSRKMEKKSNLLP